MNLERPIAPDPYEMLPAVGSLTVLSDSFSDGDPLPDRHAFAHDNVAPALSWSGAPEGTQSFVVTCFDPDAPTPSGFWHWTAVGIPGDATALPAGGELPSGAFTVRNDFGEQGFGGAAPPPGDRPHRYMFAVHALDSDDLGLDADTPPAKVAFTILGQTLARGVVTGLYAIDAS